MEIVAGVVMSKRRKLSQQKMLINWQNLKNLWQNSNSQHHHRKKRNLQPQITTPTAPLPRLVVRKEDRMEGVEADLVLVGQLLAVGDLQILPAEADQLAEVVAEEEQTTRQVGLAVELQVVELVVSAQADLLVVVLGAVQMLLPPVGVDQVAVRNQLVVTALVEIALVEIALVVEGGTEVGAVEGAVEEGEAVDPTAQREFTQEVLLTTKTKRKTTNQRQKKKSLAQSGIQNRIG